MSEANRSSLFWGALLVLVGLAFLLNNFNVIPGSVFSWWPLFVVGAGIVLLGRSVTRRRGGGLVGGTLLVGLGGFWLLQNLGRVDDRLFVPVLLIALGAGLLLRSLMRAE